MSRYIDAEELKSAIRKAFPNLMMRVDINSIINAQPTADVVEVIRCKDCTRQLICYHSDDYYCADGERREDAT